MELYGGIDLHSNNSYVVLQDPQYRRQYSRRLPNRIETILAALAPFREQVVGIAVESTFNWYWLVDGLMEAGYQTHLANTSAIKQYEGLKYVDDQHDAGWLARLLQLGILPTGYIYPREERPLRDLLRRRTFLMRQHTANLLSLQNFYRRYTGSKLSANALKRRPAEKFEAALEDPHLGLAMRTGMAVGKTLQTQIARIEKSVLQQAKLRPEFEPVKTVPGIGDILGLTIMYEVGEIGRFAAVGNFASYCRCVQARRLSNGKKKGRGNPKNGNPYLSWAFTEAAQGARRFEPLARRFYDRKSAESGPVLATRALAHKIARASFYLLRDQVPFEATKLFG